MGFDDGSIILDSDNGAYYAGQTVFGRVVFDQGKPKTIHGIYVSCKGFCKVHWTTTETRRDGDREVHETIVHESYEEYFNRKSYIFGDASGEYHLQQGHHEFRFDCPIPNNCPSAFEGTYGHVRYRVKVVMVTTGMFSSNKEKMVPIRVHAPLDLNENPYCKEPIEFELINSYCCWCVTSGSSEIRVRLPVAGYCPGQVMPIEVNVTNLSNVEIDLLKFALTKTVRYQATQRSGTRVEDERLAEIRKGPIPAGTTRNWTLEMSVPVMDIYNMNACRFIEMEHFFQLCTEVSGCHQDEEENRRIIFGTIPLVGFQDTVTNPLHDQLPQPMNVQNVQGGNPYPNSPIMNQPTSNTPYPNGGGYPQNTPYPSGAPYPTTPTVTPYPAPQNQPYPNVSPYPAPQNQPYPNVSPYPASNPPYPTSSPYPPGNLPQPSPVPAYPGANPSPYPADPNITNTSLLKTANPGFVVPGAGDPAKVPLLPPGSNVPYPTTPGTNPYATASAPAPSTPGDDKPPPYPAYNPEYVSSEKKEKDEKH